MNSQEKRIRIMKGLPMTPSPSLMAEARKLRDHIHFVVGNGGDLEVEALALALQARSEKAWEEGYHAAHGQQVVRPTNPYAPRAEEKP